MRSIFCFGLSTHPISYFTKNNKIMFDNMIAMGKSSKKNQGFEYGRRFIELESKEMSGCYSPFESPHILRRDLQPTLNQGKIAKELFKGEWDTAEQWELDSDGSTLAGSQPELQGFISEGSKQVLKEIVQSLKNSNINIENGAQILNSQYFYKIGFSDTNHLKYPDTPMFKKLLKDPFVVFESQYAKRIIQKRNLVVRSGPVPKMENVQDQNPIPIIQQLSYRYFIILADRKKSQQAYAEAQAFYRLALYLQPFDELCWQAAIKLLQECGQYRKALSYTKCALLTTKLETLTDRYLRLRERACQSLDLIRGLPSYFVPMDGKHDRFYKMLYEVSRNYYAQGHVVTSFKLLYYLLRCSESSTIYLADIAKMVEAEEGVKVALNFLSDQLSLPNRLVKIPNVYHTYMQYCQKQLEINDLVRNLEWIDQMIVSIPQQNRWRLYLDLGSIYFKIGIHVQALRAFRNSVDCAPASQKVKAYLWLYKLAGKQIPDSKVPAIILEINKQKFLIQQTPKYHQFSEWKYYFHYNLFYIYQRDKKAKELFDKATKEWSASGRLRAQCVFSDRIRKSPTEMLQKIGQILKELPKSGQLWCQCGRIFVELKKYTKALKCFRHAMFLTPQYGDSFIEGYKVLLILGKRSDAEQYKRRVVIVDPTYGNVWSYLKFADSRCSSSQNWQRARAFVEKSLSRGNTKYAVGETCEPIRQLTAIDEFNELIDNPQKLTSKQREYLFFAYDQIEPKKN